SSKTRFSSHDTSSIPTTKNRLIFFRLIRIAFISVLVSVVVFIPAIAFRTLTFGFSRLTLILTFYARLLRTLLLGTLLLWALFLTLFWSAFDGSAIFWATFFVAVRALFGRLVKTCKAFLAHSV